MVNATQTHTQKMKAKFFAAYFSEILFLNIFCRHFVAQEVPEKAK